MRHSPCIGSLLAPILIAAGVFGVEPVVAGEPFACNAAKASVLRVDGDRARARAQYAQAARHYLAAARSTRDCTATPDAVLSAQTLAQAGAALALGGDELRGLSLLHDAASRLVEIAARDRAAAPRIESVLARVQRVISAVDDVARSSM